MATQMIRTSIRTLCAAATLSCACVAEAAINVYSAVLSGANESPANASPGSGLAVVMIDTVNNTIQVHVDFTGLTSGTTASHIHAATDVALTGTAGVATQLPTFSGFPLGVTAGTYSSSTFDLLTAATYNPAFVTANGGTPASAEAALLGAISSGKAYLNIHTSNFPSGEIRGFLIAVVPEPATWAMMLVGFGGIGMAMRRSRRRNGAMLTQAT